MQDDWTILLRISRARKSRQFLSILLSADSSVFCNIQTDKTLKSSVFLHQMRYLVGTIGTLDLWVVE
jgi:hypothetical protein